MGQEGGEKWTAAADLQPTLPRSDRLLDSDASGTAPLQLLDRQALARPGARRRGAFVTLATIGTLGKYALPHVANA